MALCLKGRICVYFLRSIRWNQMRFLKGHLVTRKSLQFESAQKFRHSRGFHISVSNCLADKKLPDDEITGQAKPSSSDESNNSSSESSDSSDSSDEEGRMKTPENRLDGRPKEAGNQNISTIFKIEKKVYHLAIKNKIQSLQDEFNVKISFIYDRKASNIGKLFIKGPDKHCVFKAKKEIEKMKRLVPDSLVEEFSIPEPAVKHVIGTAGRNLKKLGEKYGIVIDVVDNKVSLLGNDSAILQDAKTEILKLCEENSEETKLDGRPKEAEKQDIFTTFRLEENVYNLVIKNKIQSLQDEFNVKINFAYDRNISNTGILVIKGPNKNFVLQAKKEIKYMMHLVPSRSMEQIEHSEQTSVPEHILKHVIGSEGRKINALQNKFEVAINIADNGNIRVFGKDPEKVKSAIQEIEEISKSSFSVETSVYPFVVTMESPVDKLKHVIGAGGKNLRQLKSKYDVDINVQNSGQITVRGVNEEVVNKVVEELINTIESASDMDCVYPFVVTMESPVDKIKHVIGAGGKNLRQLKSKFDVVINVQKTGQITVRGVDEEVVNKVVEELNNTIESASDMDGKPDRSVYPFVVTMEAPVDRMKHVVGTGGKNLNKLTSKYDVDIHVQKTGQITVRGVDEEVVNIVVEELNNTIESASDMDGELNFPIVSKRIPFEEVDYKASFEKWSDFFNKGQPLGIFTEEDVAKMNETEQPVFHSKLWDEYQQEVALAEEKASVYNAFQEDIIKTKEGKLWQFPINNDQDWKEEENVSFADHVFLEQYLDEFPNKGPIRHFMELVTVGLSKNPYLTVKQKQEHIEWYKDYFRKHEGVLKDILGEGAQFGQNTDSK